MSQLVTEKRVLFFVKHWPVFEADTSRGEAKCRTVTACDHCTSLNRTEYFKLVNLIVTNNEENAFDKMKV
jgi:hypothetical protein